MTKQLLTTTEAARALGVTRNAVNKMIERKVLEASKFGVAWLITREAVEAAKNREDKRRKDAKATDQT